MPDAFLIKVSRPRKPNLYDGDDKMVLNVVDGADRLSFRNFTYVATAFMFNSNSHWSIVSKTKDGGSAFIVCEGEDKSITMTSTNYVQLLKKMACLILYEKVQKSNLQRL